MLSNCSMPSPESPRRNRTSSLPSGDASKCPSGVWSYPVDFADPRPGKARPGRIVLLGSRAEGCQERSILEVPEWDS